MKENLSDGQFKKNLTQNSKLDSQMCWLVLKVKTSLCWVKHHAMNAYGGWRYRYRYRYRYKHPHPLY